MKVLPTVIDMFTKFDEPFSFLVKERLGGYHVRDYEEGYLICRKRELPVKKVKTKYDGDLWNEIFEEFGLAVRRINDTEFLYVDPEYEQYEDVDLPLYKDTQKGCTYIKTNTSYVLKNVPTKETVKKANEYMYICQKKINELAINADIILLILQSNDMVSTVYTNSEDVEKVLDPEKFLTFHIRKPYKFANTYKTLVISKEKARKEAKNGMVKISVSKDVAEILIAGENIKELSEKLGLEISVLVQ